MILISICLFIGWLLAHDKDLPENLPSVLSQFAVRVSLPALVLQHLHKLAFDASLIVLIATPWIVFITAALGAQLAGRIWLLPKQTIGCLTLVCGTGNTSIVGIPLIQAFAGSSTLAYALVLDQSNFIVMCTAGMLTANIYADRERSWASITKQIITYRPIQMMIAALLLRPITFPDWLDQTLTLLGSTLTPVALVAVGAGFRKHMANETLRNFVIGMGLKLLIVPAVVLALWRLSSIQDDVLLITTVLQSAMPPMIIAGLIAIDMGLDPPLARMLVAVGIPLSFLSSAFWYACLA